MSSVGSHAMVMATSLVRAWVRDRASSATTTSAASSSGSPVSRSSEAGNAMAAVASASASSASSSTLSRAARKAAAKGASEVYIIKWETRKVRFLLRESGLIYRLDWAPDGTHLYYGLAPDAADEPRHRVVRAAARRLVLKAKALDKEVAHGPKQPLE